MDNKLLIITVILLSVTLIVTLIIMVFPQFFKVKSINSHFTLQSAQSVAEDFMSKQTISYNSEFVLQPKLTQERKFGYVFFFTNKAFIDSDNVIKLVPGLGPVIVEYSGKVFSLSSAGDPNQTLNNYEEQWLKIFK